MNKKNIIVEELTKMRRRFEHPETRRGFEDTQIRPFEWACFLFEACLAVGLSTEEAESTIGLSAFREVEDTLVTDYQSELEQQFAQAMASQ